jgi:hypothetical protein
VRPLGFQRLLCPALLADVDANPQQVGLFADAATLPLEVVGQLVAIPGLKIGLDLGLPSTNTRCMASPTRRWSSPVKKSVPRMDANSASL